MSDSNDDDNRSSVSMNDADSMARSDGDDEIDEFGNVIRSSKRHDTGGSGAGPSNANQWAVEAMEDVEIIVQEEDTEPITAPIVKPIVIKKFSHNFADKGEGKSIPRTNFDFKFMHNTLMEQHESVRNIAIIGSLLHGKTTFVDRLIEQTHPDINTQNPEKPARFTDTLYTEQERGISIKSSPVSIVHQNLRFKSYLLNLMDTPGHVNFSDEVTAALRLCDGVVLMVDAVEGVLMNTKRLIKHALDENMAIVLCINKIDRLILELKFPPQDAYHKLKQIIDDINELIYDFTEDETKLVSPTIGNVCFASSQYSLCFTLESFAKSYLERSQASTPGKYCDVSYKEFAKKLWGRLFKIYDEESNRYKFTSHRPSGKSAQYTFVEFILEPIYKLFRLVIEEPEHRFLDLATNFNIKLTKEQKKLNVKPLLKITCSQFFGPFNGFVDMISKFIPSPKYNAPTKCHHIWTGPLSGELASAIYECDPKGPLVVQVTKQYASQDASAFNVFGLVLSGTLRVGNDVRVLGESYSALDEEDSRVLPVNRLWIYNSRYSVEVRSIPAGNWALIEGVDQPIVKTATIIDFDYHEELFIFRPLKFDTKSVIKVAVEPVNPSELPKMLDGFRKCNKSYPLLQTKVEASGEHVIIGTGELYLDCVMHDLRHMYSEIEIRISDPGVCFSETVVGVSSERCVSESPNEQYQFTMIAEPLEKDLDVDLEEGRVSLERDQQYIDKFFKKGYDWDDLSCRSIWAFGPEVNSTNILLNDTLDYEVRPDQLNKIKGPIVHAFQWTTREGPLCDEPMRAVKFKLQHAMIARDPLPSDVSQVISTTRKVSYLSFLTAEPRLMEPYLYVEIVAPPDVVSDAVDDRGRKMKNIIEKIIVDERRGRILKRAEVPGTPLHRVTAALPAIDSFGFETDLRFRTTGQAFCQSVFYEWRILPEDPLNKSVDAYLTSLEPQRTEHLAREFLLKTRRRKGLSEDVNIEMFMMKPK